MRYQNWDVLVFPGESKIPLQEFKTECHVIHDLEAPSLLPIITSFMPSLPAAAPFQVSIHSWQNPQICRTIQNSDPTSSVVFEARLFLDGRLAVTKILDQNGPWPSILKFDVENGEPERLKFPTFHREVLLQSYWNAGDDFGRVKLVIAEGFAREDQRFERVKNIIAFAFQHAPLEALESSRIAWPNAAMWKQASPTYDPYTEPVHAAFNGSRQVSAESSNISMPDVESRKASQGSGIL